MRDYKYRDKNHPPVPRLKVGDRCYAHSEFGRRYSNVATCEVRKVEVVWYEPTAFEIEQYGTCGHWNINYYIRMNVEYPSLKSTKRYAYRTNEDGRPFQTLFFTAQEVMDENIREFKETFNNTLYEMRQTMKKIGYTDEQIKNLLESDNNVQKALTDGTEK